MESRTILASLSIFMLAAFCLLPYCYATLNADIQNSLGQVELRPAEKTAEELFSKFGNHPWVGGDPWAGQENIILPQLHMKKVQKDTSGPATLALAAKANSNLSYYLIGILNTKQLVLSDICFSNQTCDLNSTLPAPGGIYNVYMVMNDSRYVGLWLELEQENSSSNAIIYE
jgi:hypothetical protein